MWVLIGVKPIAVCPETVNMAVLAGQNGSPARPANGIAHKAVLKKCSLGSDPVNIRRDVMFLNEPLHPGLVSTQSLQ